MFGLNEFWIGIVAAHSVMFDDLSLLRALKRRCIDSAFYAYISQNIARYVLQASGQLWILRDCCQRGSSATTSLSWTDITVTLASPERG